MVEPRTAHLPLRSELPDLHSPQAVAELVGLPLNRLTWWVWALPHARQYRRFAVVKKDGSPRDIEAPIAPIKRIQRSIASAFTDAYRAPAHVHGFTPNRSPVTNAAIHIDQRWLFAIDLEDFFPSIAAARVRGLFLSWPFEYPEAVANLLTRICCFRDGLPQGAPTSPIVSNYICRGMDRDLAKLAMSHRCYYTRYADDLVFSTDRVNFPTGIATLDGGIAEPSLSLRKIIEGAGFKINESKTRMQISFQRQRVTGLIVNKKVNVPRHYLRGVRALLHIWRRYDAEEASKSLKRASPDPNWPLGKPYPSLAAVARGRVQYIGSVRGWNDPAYLKLAHKLSELDPNFKAPTTTPGIKIRAHLYTEGNTDSRHIRAALKHFQARGEFTDLELIIDEETPRGGDKQLNEYCEHLVEFGTEELAIGLFDWDTKAAKVAVGSEGWEELGSKVVAVGLAHPPWRGEYEPRCIELLYENSVLETKDEDGRRVYRMAEFHETTSIHESESCVVPHSGRGKEHLIAPEVFQVGTNAQVARSKAAFARAIEVEPESFPTLSFEGFRPTFDRITVALTSLVASDEP
ncbi:MAG TPA: reverse transcriptase domain-containing protein [Solirubrobacterales bacterium]|nr:reverse transcriptase domain-containing protein [Solirubrobacterales bacterium]